MEPSEIKQILTRLQDIVGMISKLQEDKVVAADRSLEINELASSLAKAQAEMPVAELNKSNPYFKSAYADLMSIVGASRPYLSKNGLAVTQQITDCDDGSWLITTLWHTSGQWISSRRRIVPAKNDIQTISSHTTYLKRMCYAALIGVVTGDEDDDGERAVATSRDTFAKGTALNHKYNPRDNSPEVITREQLEEAEYELADHPDICEMILEGWKIQSLADMPKDKFLIAMKRIREIKNSRTGK
jgi:hypothetical protein